MICGGVGMLHLFVFLTDIITFSLSSFLVVIALNPQTWTRCPQSPLLVGFSSSDRSQYF